MACGGDGGDAASPTAPVVTSASAGAAKYAQKLVLTIDGSNLDQGLSVSATGCRDITLGTTAPQASSATTAYYQCTVSAAGAGQFVVARASDGANLSTVPFTVPVPQVTMLVSNGAGVDGTLLITLAPDKTPITVDNFLAYVNAGFYDGTVIHRVSPGFVIQGGGYAAPLDSNSASTKPTGPPIALEVNKGLSNTQWTIAMARALAPASATSQFFINLVDNSAVLDPSPINGDGFAVFGNVSSSIDTLNGIVGAPCTAIPFFLPSGECTPTPNIVVTSAVQSR
jgi:cyclophilin family peptidyl-prolyl cis-trans isomerase